MTRLMLAGCLLMGATFLCSCSEPSHGIEKPDTVVAPPERIKGSALPPPTANDATQGAE